MNLLIVFNRKDFMEKAYLVKDMGTTRQALTIAKTLLGISHKGNFEYEALSTLFHDYKEVTDKDVFIYNRIITPSIEINLDSGMADVSDAFYSWVDSDYEGSLEGAEELIATTLLDMDICCLDAVLAQLDTGHVFTDDCFVITEIE